MAKLHYLTPLMRERLVQIRQHVQAGLPRHESAHVMNISQATMLSTLTRLFGESTWPPVIDMRLFDLPVHEQPVPTNGGRASPSGAAEYEEIKDRVEKDQAARRAQREQWLKVEQDKYGLKRRGKPIDDMPV